MNKKLNYLITDLNVALAQIHDPVKAANFGLTVSEVGEPFVKLLETVIPEVSKFQLVVEALIEFLMKVSQLFFKNGEFKKPGFFKYISVAKMIIDLIVKIWKIF